MYVYDVAVVGAGPAGIMAAIQAGKKGKNAVLLEKNDSIGRKLLLTGQGRCNLTNIASLGGFIEKFGREGAFLRSAFSSFFNQDLMDFFNFKGLKMKIERQGRVFPVTDKAYSVVKVLENSLSENKIKILYNMRVLEIKKRGDFFHLILKGKLSLKAKKVILAAGGASYKITGSSGDGFSIAERLGHTIVSLKPALVPLKTKERWVKDLQGLGLKNVRITFIYGTKKKIVSEIGEMIFTHFGVSGPLVLDLSGRVIFLLDRYKEISLLIDLKPGLNIKKLEEKLLIKFQHKGNTLLKNIMKDLLPKKLIPVFIRLAGLDGLKNASQITQEERNLILNLLKALPLTIISSLPIEEAMVTCGGVFTKEINPKTMESKNVSGLYFAGEILDGCASSGGYNLQQAFSTGYLAGTRAAEK